MTPEEMQRAIEFLVDHDAKFAVKMDQIENAQLKFQLQLGSIGDAVIALTGMVGRVMEAQIKTEAVQRKTDERLASLRSDWMPSFSLSSATSARIRTAKTHSSIIPSTTNVPMPSHGFHPNEAI